jgi:hypothetical protein
VLSAPEQTTRLGLYDQMGAPAALLAPERDPQTGRQEPGEPGAKRALARPGKRNRQEQEASQREQEMPEREQEAPEKIRRFLPRAVVIGAAAVVVLAGAGVATALLSRAQSPPNGGPPAVVSVKPGTPGTTPGTPGTTPGTPGTTPGTPPALTLPPDQTVEATGPDGATVTYKVSASDARGGTLTPGCRPASGSVFRLGTTTVNCSAADAQHNTATGSFTVTVQDTTPPSLNLPGDITAQATGPNGAAVSYTATAADLVDGSVTELQSRVGQLVPGRDYHRDLLGGRCPAQHRDRLVHRQCGAAAAATAAAATAAAATAAAATAATALSTSSRRRLGMAAPAARAVRTLPGC